VGGIVASNVDLLDNETSDVFDAIYSRVCAKGVDKDGECAHVGANGTLGYSTMTKHPRGEFSDGFMG